MRTFNSRWSSALCVLALSVLTVVLAGCASTPTVVAPKDRIVVLISLDAFRADYLQKFPATNLARLAVEGVHARKMIPMFPSMTFPNHQTIVTGWRPAHHGVIHNGFYDPELKAEFAYNKPESTNTVWWGGEPIWATAIKQGRKADVFYWPGTGVRMAGVLPTEWTAYVDKTTPEEISDQGLAWLAQPAAQRPDFVQLYYHHVDSTSHKFGTEAPETAAAVAQVDAAIGRLVAGIHRLKLEEVVNLVIVSDHGMQDLSTNRVIALGDYVDLKTVKVDFSGSVAGLRPLDGDVAALYQAFKAKESHFQAYRAEAMPARYHFTGNPRIPPVVLVADDAWYFAKRTSAEPNPKGMNKATHGYDPELDAMGATFIAWGPAFQRGVTLAPFENVHLYNFLCATMGLKPAPNDGDDRLVKQVLAK